MNDAMKDEGMREEREQKPRRDTNEDDETSAAGNETLPTNDSRSD